MNGYIYFIDHYLDNILAVGAMLLCGGVVCRIVCIPYYFFRKKRKRHLWLTYCGRRTEGRITALYHKTTHSRSDDSTPDVCGLNSNTLNTRLQPAEACIPGISCKARGRPTV